MIAWAESYTSNGGVLESQINWECFSGRASPVKNIDAVECCEVVYLVF